MGCCANFIIEENIRINQSILKKGKERQKRNRNIKRGIGKVKNRGKWKNKKRGRGRGRRKIKKRGKRKIKRKQHNITSPATSSPI